MADEDKKIDVLIVEDDVFLRKILTTKFSKENFNVRSAADGEQALAMLAEKKPAMMLTDLILPRVSGFDVLAAIRKDDNLKDLPVIVLSNLGQDEDIKRVMELGALSFLIKADNSINQIVSRVKEEYAKISK